jgi:hypothetical protein
VSEMIREVFFGCMDEIDDPRLAGAVFYFAVMGSVIEQEAAVFHWISLGAE